MTIWTQRLFSGFVTIGRYGRCSAGHTLANIATATTTSLDHRPTTDSATEIATLVRRALVEVCTVPVLPVVDVVTE